MNKKVLTKKEVNDFKPSFYNPLAVTSGDDFVPRWLRNIKIISPVFNGIIAIIDVDGEVNRITEGFLGNYISHNQPKEALVNAEQVIEVLINHHLNDNYTNQHALRDLGLD